MLYHVAACLSHSNPEIKSKHSTDDQSSPSLKKYHHAHVYFDFGQVHIVWWLSYCQVAEKISVEPCASDLNRINWCQVMSPSAQVTAQPTHHAKVGLGQVSAGGWVGHRRSIFYYSMNPICPQELYVPWKFHSCIYLRYNEWIATVIDWRWLDSQRALSWLVVIWLSGDLTQQRVARRWLDLWSD